MKKKIKESLGDLKDKVVTADKIPIIEPNHLKEVIAANEDLDNGKQLRQFATLNKTDCATIFSWLMDNYGKKDGSLKSLKNEKSDNKPEKPSMSNWREKQREAKCGIKP